MSILFCVYFTLRAVFAFLGLNQCCLGTRMARGMPTQPTLQERTRERLRDWCADMTHQQIADALHLDRSAISRLFAENGSGITLDHVEGFSFLIQRSPAEIVAAPGATIQPVSPIESALLGIFRNMTELERRSLLTVLERPIASQERRAKKSRLGRAMLTVKEQELVDLFARVKRDGVREGVLKTLRGAAQDAVTEEKPHTN